MSLGLNDLITQASPPTDKPADPPADDIRASQLDKQILDEFSANMLPGLFRILDNVPETVYHVCDLIVVVIRRYGDAWRDNCLSYVLTEICELIKNICDYYTVLKEQPTSTELSLKCANNLDQKLASRLLLFSLLFEEMQLACSKIVNQLNLLDQLVNMLQLTTALTFQTKTSTPPWLTSVFILIDLIEKSSLATKRKSAINEQYSGYKRVWKWYEERQNRWISYAYANNKSIDDAYKHGETTIRIVVSRKHYTISFNSMLQINEETSHKRPVMLAFEKPNDFIANKNNEMALNSTNLNANDTLTTPFGNITRLANLTTTAEASETMNDITISRPSSPLPIEVVRGLNSSQISTVLDCCVDFISYPVSDAYCLHSILRLVLRLTRQHEYAVQFSTRRGPQYILNLTQKSSFIGYASLITLIFRHICEDEKNLRLTMEKTIRLALTGNQQNIGLQPGGTGAREFHNTMRVLGPAICRHPDLFTEVATDILRIVIRREEENQFNNGSALNNNNNNAYCLRAIQAKLMPSISLPSYAHELVIDLLNFLVKP
jgi:E3 ubiquitin-protein ligase HUWE1